MITCTFFNPTKVADGSCSCCFFMYFTTITKQVIQLNTHVMTSRQHMCTLQSELFDTLIDAPNGMGNKKYRLILAYV